MLTNMASCPLKPTSSADYKMRTSGKKALNAISKNMYKISKNKISHLRKSLPLRIMTLNFEAISYKILRVFLKPIYFKGQAVQPF